MVMNSSNLVHVKPSFSVFKTNENIQKCIREEKKINLKLNVFKRIFEDKYLGWVFLFSEEKKSL